MDLDSIDRRLLSIVQKNCRLKSETLAKMVHLSPTAVQRRLHRLRANGAIQAEVAVINPAVVGRGISMYVHVRFKSEGANVIDRFKQAVRGAPEVLSAHHVTGDTDFVLLVTVPDMAEFELFTRRVLYRVPEVEGFKTMVVMEATKTGFEIPIDA